MKMYQKQKPAQLGGGGGVEDREENIKAREIGV